MDTPPSAAPGTAAEPLQFETAAPAPQAAPATCTACRRPVGDVYHMLNGHMICSACRAQVEGGDGTGALVRLGKAALFGTGAAIAGAVIYWAVIALFQLELALVAILVGFMVGSAIRKGTGGRGGWPYQLMAVALTYLAIAMAYVPLVLQAGREGSSTSLTGAAFYLAAIIGSLMWPFLAIAKSPISALIIAIGLWQAWKQTRGPRLEISGPYSVNAPKAIRFDAPIRG